jgi:hypothetical protein
MPRRFLLKTGRNLYSNRTNASGHDAQRENSALAEFHPLPLTLNRPRTTASLFWEESWLELQPQWNLQARR